MAEETWGSLAEGTFTNDQVAAGSYLSECSAGRIQYSDGEVAGGFYLDFVILNGPDKDKVISTRVHVPTPGGPTFAGQKIYFGRKMAGFKIPDGTEFPWNADDLESNLEALIETCVGQTVLAVFKIGGKGFEDRNDLDATKPSDAAGPTKSTKSEPADVDDADPYADYTKDDLKEELKELGLPVGGPVSVLKKRLSEATGSDTAAPALNDADSDDDPGF